MIKRIGKFCKYLSKNLFKIKTSIPAPEVFQLTREDFFMTTYEALLHHCRTDDFLIAHSITATSYVRQLAEESADYLVKLNKENTLETIRTLSDTIMYLQLCFRCFVESSGAKMSDLQHGMSVLKERIKNLQKEKSNETGNAADDKEVSPTLNWQQRIKALSEKVMDMELSFRDISQNWASKAFCYEENIKTVNLRIDKMERRLEMLSEKLSQYKEKIDAEQAFQESFKKARKRVGKPLAADEEKFELIQLDEEGNILGQHPPTPHLCLPGMSFNEIPLPVMPSPSEILEETKREQNKDSFGIKRALYKNSVTHKNERLRKERKKSDKMKDKEVKIEKLIRKGMKNKDIAKKLDISLANVYVTKKRIEEKEFKKIAKNAVL